MALQKKMEKKGGEGRDLSLNMLPEGCVAKVISFTSPRDACRLSAVSSLFKSAADSDVVWKMFLPQDYQSIISESDSLLHLASISSKKELYLKLCDHKPILIQNGEKSFSLHKLSGKKCFMLSSRSLQIALSNSILCWRWRPDHRSRFAQAAHLEEVRQLEILGRINTSMLSPVTWYTAHLVFKFETAHNGWGQRECFLLAFGLDGLATVSVGLVGGEISSRYVFWNASFYLENRDEWLKNGRYYPRDRGDGWLEIELGEFFNKEGEDGELEMRVVDNNNDKMKGGLIIEGIEIRPKGHMMALRSEPKVIIIL